MSNTKEPNLKKFYSILEEHWSEQAGSQPDAEDQSEEDDDHPQDDGQSSPGEMEDAVEVVEPSPPSAVVGPTAPVSTPVVAKAVMPPPPLPAKIATLPLPPATINTASLDAKTREDMLAKVEALKILSSSKEFFSTTWSIVFLGGSWWIKAWTQHNLNMHQANLAFEPNRLPFRSPRKCLAASKTNLERIDAKAAAEPPIPPLAPGESN